VQYDVREFNVVVRAIVPHCVALSKVRAGA